MNQNPKDLNIAVQCYFSRVTEHRDTLEMDYPRIKNCKYYSDTGDAEENISSKKTRYNTSVRLAKDGKTLEFTTNGGIAMDVNTGTKITNIFPLNEGILLEFVAQEKLTIDNIYSKIRKDKSSNGQMQEEKVGQGVSYVSLNYHPYDIFRPVSIINSKTSNIWVDSPMKVIYVNKNASLCVTYNSVTKTHNILSLSIAFEGINMTENKVTPFIPQPIFSLNGEEILNKKNSLDIRANESVIKAMVLHQDHTQEEEAKKCCFIQTYKYHRHNINHYEAEYIKEFLLYIQCRNYVKIYSIELKYDCTQVKNQKFTIGKIKQSGCISCVAGMSSMKVLNLDLSLAEFADYTKSGLKEEKFLIQSDIYNANSNLEPDEHQVFNVNDIKDWVRFNSNKQVLKETEFDDAILFMDFERVLSMHMGNKDIFHFTLDKEISKRLREDENWEFVSIVNHQVTLRCFSEFSNRYISIPRAFPDLDCPYMTTILHMAMSVFDYTTFRELVKDVMYNCLDFDSNFKSYMGEHMEFCNFKEYSDDKFKRLIYYFCFLLKIDRREEFLKKDINLILGDEPIKLTKRVKPNPTQTILQHISGEDAWLSLQQDAFNDPELRDLEKYFPDVELNLNQKSSKKDKSRMDMNRVLPRISINPDIFIQYKIKFFKFVHLLVEDLKLNCLLGEARNKFSYFLYCYAYFMEVPYCTNYLEFYSRSFSNIPFEFQLDQPLQFFKLLFDSESGLKKLCDTKNQNIEVVHDNDPFYNSTLEEIPYDINKMIIQILEKKRTAKTSNYSSGNNYHSENVPTAGKYPILYRTSGIIMKILYMYFNLQNKPYFKAIKPTVLMNNNLQKTYIECFPICRLCFDKDEINNLNRKSRSYYAMYQLKKGRIRSALNTQNLIFVYIIHKKINKTFLNNLTSSCERLIKSIISEINNSLPEFVYEQPIPKRAYELIGREDIYMNKQLYPRVKNHRKRHNHTKSISRSSMIFGTPSFISGTPNSMLDDTRHFDSAYSGFKISKQEEVQDKGPSPLTDKEIIKNLNMNLHFKEKDYVYRETSRVLDIKSYMKIRNSTASKFLTEHADDKQLSEFANNYGKLLSNRRFSVLVGRGAFHINSNKSVLIDVLQIPKIKLSCILEKDSRRINLENEFAKKEKDKPDPMTWPNFHSSVAVGLELAKELVHNVDNESIRTWIRYQNIGDGDTMKQNDGLFLGLGLHGLLKCFYETDMYRYLKENEEMRGISLLLGLAASKIGTKDIKAKSAFSLHINCTRGANTDLKISQLMESSALMSLGLLYAKSCKRQQSDLMLSQIAAYPTEEKNDHRECYSLSAGFALGLVNLGRGNTIPAKNEMNIDELLLNYINGGKKRKDKYMYMPGYADEFKNSNIKEGDFVNTQLTAPSALMALALIYMKTEKAAIAKSLRIPSTIYEVTHCNPNHILLKVLTKNMVMWSKINPSEEYIEGHIPELIKKITNGSLAEIEDLYGNTQNLEEIDYSGIALIYYNSLAGSIMALGLKYSGTGNEKVKELILRYTQAILKVKTISNTFVADKAQRGQLDIYNYFNILCVCILSLSIVMAGTADIDCLKQARIIRKNLEDKINLQYGFNMAIHMAIGFLSLGRGAYTFGREDLHIAALLISIYPQFPNNPDDNKYHLQAYRHFYALAVVPNLFHAIDIDTKESAIVNFEVISDSIPSKVMKLMTPAYLQGVDQWKRVKLNNKDYYHNDFTFDSIDENNPPRLLFIKKKYDKRINLKQLEKAIQVFKFDKNVPKAQIQKIFGTHFFGQLYNMYSSEGNSGKYLHEDQLMYLLPSTNQTKRALQIIVSKMEQEKENSCQNEDKKRRSMILNLFYSLLKQSKLPLLEDNLEFMFSDQKKGSTPFSKISNLERIEDTELSDYFLMLQLFNHHFKQSKSIWEVRESEMESVKSKLREKMKFTQKELLVLKKIGLRVSNAWNLTPDFKTKSEYKKFMSKVRYHKIPLNNIYTNIIRKIDKIKTELQKKEVDLDKDIFWQSVEHNDILVTTGLNAHIRSILGERQTN